MIKAEREGGMHGGHRTAPIPQSWNPSGDSLRELVLHMVQHLVDIPARAAVSAIEGEHTVILKVTVAPCDVGKVIGKKGRIAEALRTILSAAAGKRGKRALMEVIEEHTGGRERL